MPRRADAFFTLARRGRLTGGRVCSRGDRRGRGVADRVPGGPAPAAYGPAAGGANRAAGNGPAQVGGTGRGAPKSARQVPGLRSGRGLIAMR
ncbi:hypothetical protein Shyhy02_38720 [Streptomyces hygroscopicus subsp. hygroscopicus]|nr:hypothetical protein Shyhy02_38720 [Streptomyces hygroscopicus subsp. hygroscopicus]